MELGEISEALTRELGELVAAAEAVLGELEAVEALRAGRPEPDDPLRSARDARLLAADLTARAHAMRDRSRQLEITLGARIERARSLVSEPDADRDPASAHVSRSA